ncbi:MAG: cyclic nucleotide-binding domain-containing protein [Spirochaetes bacterium]|nr:cyclic nucleotide-binding domain-containing protein [Spirochaetota bacterium]
MGEYFEFLRRVYFFRNLSDDEIRLVESFCHEERYSAGDILFVEGTQADRFFIVTEGKVEVWKNFYDAKADLLAVHGPGHFFGEMALVDDLPRSATVVAREETRVASVYREDFRTIVRENLSIALSIMTSISFLVRSSNELYVEGLRKRKDELEAAYRELEKAHSDRLLSERLSTLGKFSSIILHDIRNPLSMLKGQLQLMETAINDPDRLRHYMKNASGEVDRMERLAGEFLDFTRGDIRLNMSVVRPCELLDRVVDAIKPAFDRDGIAIVVECTTDEHAILDKDRIMRVLINIADNARKASSPGDSFTMRSYLENGRLVFELEDAGEGMNEKTRDRLFEPFFSMSKRGGTGLGLMIVRNIIESHGGAIRIDSKPGEGTQVIISIPHQG